MGKLGAIIGAIIFVILFRGDIASGGGFYLFSAVIGGVIFGGIIGKLLGFIMGLFSKAREKELTRIMERKHLEGLAEELQRKIEEFKRNPQKLTEMKNELKNWKIYFNDAEREWFKKVQSMSNQTLGRMPPSYLELMKKDFIRDEFKRRGASELLKYGVEYQNHSTDIGDMECLLASVRQQLQELG